MTIGNLTGGATRWYRIGLLENGHYHLPGLCDALGANLLNASPILFSDFKMVEDGKYEFFPWGKVSFSRLMASLRQEYFMDKQLYRLGGIPQVLNVWMFELCSNVDTKVVVKEDAEQMSKEVDDYTCTNRKKVLVKEDLDSLESNIKTYVKTYIDMKFNDLEHAMNDRFSELLMSLQLKNKNMEKEHVAKQSLKGDQSSEDVVIFEGHSNPISPHFVMEKIEEMKKNIVQQNGQDGEPSADVVHDAVPTSVDSPMKEMDKSVEMEEDKVNQAPSPFKRLSHEVVTLTAKDVDVIMYYLRKKYKKMNFSINRYTTTDCFFKVYTDKTYVNYYEADVAVITLKDRCIRVYDSIASSWKRTKTSEIEELAIMILTYLQYSDFLEQKVPTDWTALASYKGKTERDPFQVEYISEIAQQDFGSLDCGVFLAVYAEYLSEGLGIPSSGVDA
ncbi:hypothetical protein CQW23_16534 [Capsicum baccatum]|uniref:Ubiquitin-like protease family profile domain-containing protein n=1 Tax=Capsicum baccatum TaxID=33114 RepID=A0A2G2WBF6_CAPBA|nr:hypothetical protein CQW23_16534 [Capsicum baccatum]